MKKLYLIKKLTLCLKLLSLKTIKEAESFFRDLCTIEEIKEMSERWKIIGMLENKTPYRKIADKLKVSTTTVSRVANWLNHGEGGYQLILNRISHHHNPSFGKRL